LRENHGVLGLIQVSGLVQKAISKPKNPASWKVKPCQNLRPMNFLLKFIPDLPKAHSQKKLPENLQNWRNKKVKFLTKNDSQFVIAY
jgi:hypothetical protein